MNQILDIQASQQQALLYLLNYLKQQKYQFTAITPLSHQRILDRRQSNLNNEITLKDIFGWNLRFKKTNLDPVLFSLLEEHQLLQVQGNQYLSQVRVASLDNELFIHSAFPTMEQDAVFFGPDTYRFAYHLKQYLASQSHPFKRALELCCGTSATAVSIAKYFPDFDELVVADLNPKALLYSRINIDFAGYKNIHPVHSNLFSNIKGKFDLIFANPPYLIDPHQRHYRHGGHELDGCDLSFRIIKEGIQRLNPQGCLFLYTGVTITQDGNRFLQHLENLMKQNTNLSWSYEEIDPDIFGEELEQPAYQHVERIALALIKIERKS
ncbi:methyltransferase small domain protein [Acinetobacter sp. LoGeW2-3]|uniref:methyltransferase n=1 Tax=Acinetobacter sp. LoGeW2-3 TaxID=1808001 RepID=UPI000C05BC68|nr:class I SAM-dependent methyltransferase [Acinetobacter sp. LoGeW2-3]ATO18219.1 methyltransferase small domain protein [Acinetobacter sp. LoGeW2-3]